MCIKCVAMQPMHEVNSISHQILFCLHTCIVMCSVNLSVHLNLVIARINNKEGKRVSNALYTPYKMFSESHTSGIQKLTNESARFKWYIVFPSLLFTLGNSRQFVCEHVCGGYHMSVQYVLAITPCPGWISSEL